MPHNEELKNMNIRNDQVNDIIGVIPHWFVRLGILVVFLFMIIILLGCWFFKYPDMITARTELIVNNPPVSIIAKSTGKIEKLFVTDNQQIEENEILAIIENTANFNDVFKVKIILDSLAQVIKSPESIRPIIPSDIFKLGNIQSSYAAFLKHYNDYRNFIALNYHQKMIESIRQEISQQKKYLDRLVIKLNYSNEQLSLSKKQFQRDSSLFKNEVFSASDFEKSQNQYLQSKSNVELNNTEILSLKVQNTKLEQSLLDLVSQKMELNSQQLSALKESYELAMAQIADWDRTYLLKSPVAGKVTFTTFWNNNQNIKTGELVFTIVPKNFSYYLAKIQLPIQSSGKVKVGQKVIISLDDYPYMEYGFIKGKISNISLVPDNDFYFAEVILPSKLITSYGTDITFRNKLKGSSEIIIKDERLLMRLIYPVKAIFNANSLK
jgi:multidrug resistance efflux pump